MIPTGASTRLPLLPKVLLEIFNRKIYNPPRPFPRPSWELPALGLVAFVER